MIDLVLVSAKNKKKDTAYPLVEQSCVFVFQILICTTFYKIVSLMIDVFHNVFLNDILSNREA